jgi:ORF6N domain
MLKKPEPHLPSASVESRIHTIRGQRVMLDADLASLYGVETKMLNRAVRRNPERFPDTAICHATPFQLFLFWH